ncbi:MAG: response regulator transcription factor [Tetrasphaera sp.]
MTTSDPPPPQAFDDAAAPSPHPSAPAESAEPARILLADDHALVRQGVRLILESDPAFTVVGEVSNGAAAVEEAAKGDVDLVILDISMPRLTGLQAAREIQRQSLPVAVLMLSMHDNEQYLFEALKVGAAGFVHKSVADRDLLAACHAALRGEPFLYPGALTALIRGYLARPQDDDGPVLSPREEEIVKLIAEGYSGKDIAETLFLSPKTVERHRTNILGKLGLKDRLELTRYAIRVGLIEP